MKKILKKLVFWTAFILFIYLIEYGWFLTSIDGPILLLIVTMSIYPLGTLYIWAEK